MLADATGSPRWNRYILDAAKWLGGEEGRVANWKEYEHNIDKVSFGKSLRILRGNPSATAKAFSEALESLRKLGDRREDGD